MLKHALTAPLVALTLAAAGGCGGGSGVEPATATVRPVGVGDRNLYASNVKYELIDALIARGAVAPVIDDVRCVWTSPTVADCSSRGRDRQEDPSRCGYELLPCGPFRLQAHAECADSKGHDCMVALDARPAG